MGAMGAALGGAGIAIAGATAAVSSVVDMVQAIPDQRKKAIEAIKQNKRDDRIGFEKFGLTRQLAEGAANQPAPTATTGMGIMGGLAAGFASQNSPQTRLLSMLVNDLPGALGINAGMRIGGATEEEGNRESSRAMFGEGLQGQMNMYNAVNDAVAMWNKMKGWASF